ncbi:MAG: molybdate ABC transporter substrate-binding protein [Chloroflexota bacterium]
MRVILALPILIIMLLPVISCSQENYNLNIFAAAGAKAAIDDVCQRYEEQCDTEAIATYGGGGEVLSQMILDKSGDVYIAPEQSFMEKAVTEGVVDAETIRSVAYMIPVIAVKKGNPQNIISLADLAKSGLQVAISRPETTLVGKYALEIFDEAGLTAAIEPNIVTYAANPNTLLTMLVMGEVDAIITWHYYAYLNPDKIENVSIPPEQVTGIAEMQIAVSMYSKNPEAAQEYVDFAASDEGKAVFAEHSYIVDEEEVRQYQQ